MKKSNLRIWIVCLVLLSVVFVMACPKKDVIRQAAKASYRLPGSTNDLIAQIKKGVELKIFTPAEARRFGDILDPIADVEIAFVKIVRTAERIYRETGTIPADLSKEIKDKYDEIVTLFLDLLQFAGVLDADDRAFIEVAIATVRVFLRTIGIGLGSKATVDKLDAAPVVSGPATPRKGKKGIINDPFDVLKTAWLPGSIRPFAFNPQLRFA